MRTHLLWLSALLTIGSTSLQAQGACGLFSPDASCRQGTQPRIHVDFAKGLRPEIPVRLRSVESNSRPAIAAMVPQGIDCQMIRSEDRNLDPAMVRSPPLGVKSALRVIQAPPCPGK